MIPLRRQTRILTEIETKKIKSVIKLQRWFRKYRFTYVNEHDPITLEKLKKSNPFLFRHVLPNRVIFQFDSRELAKYIYQTKNYYNPYNRIEFNKIELKRIDRLNKNLPIPQLCKDNCCLQKKEIDRNSLIEIIMSHLISRETRNYLVSI